uniref:Retrovirus-related Pol polyprotein from transposon 17.6 n=1 Tax=Schistocephalus solidus TaxID=70667 RepID=A0A0X3NNW8_SCHSO
MAAFLMPKSTADHCLALYLQKLKPQHCATRTDSSTVDFDYVHLIVHNRVLRWIIVRMIFLLIYPTLCSTPPTWARCQDRAKKTGYRGRGVGAQNHTLWSNTNRNTTTQGRGGWIPDEWWEWQERGCAWGIIAVDIAVISAVMEAYVTE